MAKTLGNPSADSQAVEPRPTRVPLQKQTTLSLGLAFISFVIPFAPAVIAIAVAGYGKRLYRSQGGDRTNEGLATLAQWTSAFTLVLYGSFVVWAVLTYG